MDYSLRDEPPRSRARQSMIAIDLSEWRGTRVLALRDSRYYPGVIRNASHGEIFIEFDGEGQLLVRYSDVLGAGKYDVIGDASPSVGQVTLDAKVCVKCPTANGHIDAMTNVFVKGTVCKIVTEQKRFVVKIPMEGDRSDSYVVNRADLRLLQPPWVDELEDGIEECEPMRTESVGENSFAYRYIEKTIFCHRFLKFRIEKPRKIFLVCIISWLLEAVSTKELTESS